MGWPLTPFELAETQAHLASLNPPPWVPRSGIRAGGAFVCFPRGGKGVGARGDPGWAAAVAIVGRRVLVGTAHGVSAAPYEPGFLALREGPLLEEAVRQLSIRPDVLLVNATGRDHPRRAGLAVHLGAVLDLPTVGVTNRPLIASGLEPGRARFDRVQLMVDDEPVGYVVRTRPEARPLCVHAGWRTTPEVAVDIVEGVTGRFRTPEPIRRARTIARRLRSGY